MGKWDATSITFGLGDGVMGKIFKIWIGVNGYGEMG